MFLCAVQCDVKRGAAVCAGCGEGRSRDGVVCVSAATLHRRPDLGWYSDLTLSFRVPVGPCVSQSERARTLLPLAGAGKD